MAVTNLGAILFSRQLDAFPSLARKALRIIRYDGADRSSPKREKMFPYGYAAGMEKIWETLDIFLPMNEVIKKGERLDSKLYPDIAVRELLANALIHQDFSITGTGPIVEIFSDRLEITNPGPSLLFKNSWWSLVF